MALRMQPCPRPAATASIELLQAGHYRLTDETGEEEE